MTQKTQSAWILLEGKGRVFDFIRHPLGLISSLRKLHRKWERKPFDFSFPKIPWASFTKSSFSVAGIHWRLLHTRREWVAIVRGQISKTEASLVKDERWGGGKGWLFCSVFYLQIWPTFLQRLRTHSTRPVVNLIHLIFWAILWPLHPAPTRNRLPEGSEVGLL